MGGLPRVRRPGDTENTFTGGLRRDVRRIRLGRGFTVSNQVCNPRKRSSKLDILNPKDRILGGCINE